MSFVCLFKFDCKINIERFLVTFFACAKKVTKESTPYFTAIFILFEFV
ncbi:hypothetical protein COI_2572 [Mannheimia haemolytica serotype A2 str. OVINE]|nr:hypothetical protein COI_2572 [Mannheimia haemolytica serotype A2 str. OVINE]EEY11613.1 hypothetical protein COK_2315 [Mannheimia haemolytica serotype A2 str. BOVINE]